MLNYTEHGDAARPSVLIAHGLYGSGRNWNVIAKRLSDTRHVITVDMRNHGHSFWSDDHSYHDLARDLAEVIGAFGGRMDVVGHSMGGKAAMVLALSHPDHVNRMVIGDIAPVAYGHSQMQYIEAMRRVDLSGITRRSEANAQLAALGVERALCQFLTQSLDVSAQKWRLNLEALAANMPKILGFPDVAGSFAGSVLFLSGATSDYVAPAYRGTIRALFPAARFAKISQAGHWLHADNPRAFEGTLRAYLDAPDP